MAYAFLRLIDGCLALILIIAMLNHNHAVTIPNKTTEQIGEFVQRLLHDQQDGEVPPLTSVSAIFFSCIRTAARKAKEAIDAAQQRGKPKPQKRARVTANKGETNEDASERKRARSENIEKGLAISATTNSKFIVD